MGGPSETCPAGVRPHRLVLLAGGALLVLLAGMLVAYCVATWGRRDAVLEVSSSGGAPDPLDVAAGEVLGTSFARVTGRNSNLGLATPEDVWDGGGDLPALPATPAVLTVVSTSGADAAGGTGATSLVLHGIGWPGTAPGPALVDVSETVLLSGATPVLSVNAYLCVNTAHVAGAGSARVNVGTVTGVWQGALAFQISPTLSGTLTARFLVPDGATAFVTAWRAGLNQPPDPSRTVIFTLWAQPLGGPKTILDWTAVHSAGSSVSEVSRVAAPLRAPARTLLTITASATAAASDVFCSLDLTLRRA